MPGPEKTYENRIKQELDKRGHWWLKYWSGSKYTKAGIPDLLCSINGFFVAIEVKAEKGVVAPLQWHQIGVIQQQGGVAFTLRPSQWESFVAWMDAVEQLDVHILDWTG